MQCGLSLHQNCTVQHQPHTESAATFNNPIVLAGASYTVGFANVGESSGTCQPQQCSPGNVNCQISVQSEDASLSWGPLVAASFSADYHVIAWSGSEFVTYSNGSIASADDAVSSIRSEQQHTPPSVQLFNRQIATDVGSVTDFSKWQPQVSAIEHCLSLILATKGSPVSSIAPFWVQVQVHLAELSQFAAQVQVNLVQLSQFAAQVHVNLAHLSQFAAPVSMREHMSCCQHCFFLELEWRLVALMLCHLWQSRRLLGRQSLSMLLMT